MFQRHENGILNYNETSSSIESNDKQLFGKKLLYAIFQEGFGNTTPGHGKVFFGGRNTYIKLNLTLSMSSFVTSIISNISTSLTMFSITLVDKGPFAAG